MMQTLRVSGDYDDWRGQARALLARGVHPDEVLWTETADEQLLLLSSDDAAASPAKAARVPREYAELAYRVFHHRSPQRFWILYRLLWRLSQGERDLLQIDVDDDVRQARLLERQVKWDAHRMTAFVRFERARDAEGELFLAWYRPDHHVLPLCASSFVRRFRSQRWSILTPEDSAHWDRKTLRFGPGVEKRPATGDQLVALWQTYYSSTYNPQRDNPKLFRQHVPTRFLRDMPENYAAIPGRKPR